ncbi:Glutamate--cysteine ligase [Buchnera aphidicola (Eriosoma lanigerum)]|uniref:glutamate--cysteine ligase n=1 Tax=Buchnera aphidicola TaxID=9 RepID=UPI003463F1AE
MISNLSNKIQWIQDNPTILKNIKRGIERETIRINLDGQLSYTPHPNFLGSALTHKWITTDFSESSLEFITPSCNNINYILQFLKNTYHFVTQNIINERMWPLSMPPNLPINENLIPIAQYGSSPVGIIKSIYRNGLRNRYGSSMNMISGVHYNFSLPEKFWKIWKQCQNKQYETNYISSGYFHIIRNYHRFGWIIPYLFGSSPTICSNLLKNKKNIKHLKKTKKTGFYAPWSTSLRLSPIGYQNQSNTNLNITFNYLDEYLNTLKYAINTPFPKFVKIGLKNSFGMYNQINTNILQMENEFYTPIRPKRVLKHKESYLEALYQKGIEYIEVRSLDVNPFSPIGISKTEILLLDLFLIWCSLIKSPTMTLTELNITKENWNRIIFEGRKPNQSIIINSTKKNVSLVTISKMIFYDLFKIAEILDKNYKNNDYYNVCKKLIKYFDHPDLTYSSKILNIIIENGIQETGLKLSNQYYNQFKIKKLNPIINKKLFKESFLSIRKQNHLEQ